MRRMCVWMLTIGGLVGMSVPDAMAQGATYHGYATGFLGSVGAGDLPRTSLGLGAAVSVIESSGWGADMDFAFSDDDTRGTDADVTTFMLNANWTKPSGMVRPYVAGGIGVVRLHGCLSGCPRVTSTTDFGVDAGGGAYVRITDVVFARGEVKYLWAPGKHPDLSRPDNYGFLRATVGVTFMWTLVP